MLQKTGDMEDGAVAFHNDRLVGDYAFGLVVANYSPKVRRGWLVDTHSICYTLLTTHAVHVPTRENAIVNPLNKSKTEREVDFIAEKIDKQRELGQVKKKEAIARVSVSLLIKSSSLNALQKQAADQAIKQMQQDKAARSYDTLWTAEEEEEASKTQPQGMDMEDDFM